MQNFFSNVSGGGGGGQDGSGGGAQEGMPWYMKYAGKGAGILAGVAAIFFGFWAAISFSPTCIVAGLWQIVAGFLIIVIEAPFCCMFLDFVQQFSSMVEGRPVWQKAAVYLVFSLPPFFLCLSLGVLVGSGCVFALSVFNALQALGKKASREEMAAAASGRPQSVPVPPPVAAGSTTKSDSMSSGLVGNIHGQDVEAARGNL